jgi:hypothetical protein
MNNFNNKNNEKIYLIFAIFTLLTSCTTLTQKTAETPTENYVVLTSNVKQLKPIFLAAKDLSTEDGVNFGEFKVNLR